MNMNVNVKMNMNMRACTIVRYQASMPSSLKKEAWNLQDFITTLQTKIVERTKRPSDQFREGAGAVQFETHLWTGVNDDRY